MKYKMRFISVLLLVTFIGFAQKSVINTTKSNAKGEVITTANGNRNSINCPPGYVMESGKCVPLVDITLKEGMNYTISAGVRRGKKDLMSSDEVKEALASIITNGYEYVNSQIIVIKDKPILLVRTFNPLVKGNETISMPLEKEGNYLVMTDSATITKNVKGKTVTTVKKVSLIGPKRTGHVTLLK